ncbi:40S ribosomal protein SA, partial [Galemys pyrenaicus]
LKGSLNVLKVEENVLKFLAAGTHFGVTKLDLRQYIYRKKLGEASVLACVAINNPKDVHVMKFESAPKTTPIAGGFTP